MTKEERNAALNPSERRGLDNAIRLLDGSQPIDAHAAICGLRKQYPQEFNSIAAWHMDHEEG